MSGVRAGPSTRDWLGTTNPSLRASSTVSPTPAQNGIEGRLYTSRMFRILLLTAAATLVLASSAQAQAIGGPEKGRPVQGDPGISSMVVMDRPDFRVLRDWAEAGAVRRTTRIAMSLARRSVCRYGWCV